VNGPGEAVVHRGEVRGEDITSTALLREGRPQISEHIWHTSTSYLKVIGPREANKEGSLKLRQKNEQIIRKNDRNRCKGQKSDKIDSLVALKNALVW